MFAYCLNNPVVLVDGSGNAAHICFGYDGQRDESPWKIGSPGGGGWPQDIHYSQQDYGSAASKFYIVRALKYTQSLISRSMEIKTLSAQRESEFNHRQRAIHQAVLFSIIHDYAPDPLTAIDNISGELGVGLTALSLCAYWGIVTISPAGQAVIFYAGVAFSAWYLGRKICSYVERVFTEGAK